MTTTYPSTIDNLTNPLPTDKLNNPSHSSQHTNINDAMEAVQTYVGTSSGAPAGSLTARVIDLELNGGGGGGGDATSVDGWSVEVVATLPAVQDPNTIYFVEGAGTGDYLPLTGGTLTGALVFDGGGGELGSIDIAPDPNSSAGDTLLVESNQGVTIQGPYIVLDTSNLQLAYSGANTGEQLVIAGVDSFGIATIGLQAPLPAAYSVQDTHDANIIIKAANTAPPTAWVPLGLSVTLGADAPAGTATLQFTVTLSNPTTRIGVVEWGMTINGGAPLYRDIVTQISANFLQDVSLSVPLANGYVTGDVIALVARVTTNDNNQFSLTAIASVAEVNIMRFVVVGATGTLPAPSNMVTTDTDQQVNGQKTFTAKILGTASNADAVPWTGVSGKPSTFPPDAHSQAISTITNLQATLDAKAPLASPVFTGNPTAPTANVGDSDTSIATTAFTVAEIANRAPSKTGTGATGNWGINITGSSASCTGNAATATAVNDNGVGASITFWQGTQAAYDAIGTKNASTWYAVTN